MTDNKHAEAVEAVARALAQRFIDRGKARVTGSFYDHVSQMPRSYMADFRDDARAAIVALNTRPTEAMREACAAKADDVVAIAREAKTHPHPLSIDTNEAWRRIEDACQDVADAIRSIPVPTNGEGVQP